MPSRYTDVEWTTFINEVEQDLIVSQEPYPCPEVGDRAFMKTIDHTLLKLDTKAVQIDELCAEARVDGFAVSYKNFRLEQVC
jgi:deoxyribose-phosphate aldolase